MPHLRSLQLNSSTELTDLSPVLKLKKLETLEVLALWELQNLDPIGQFGPQLKKLVISDIELVNMEAWDPSFHRRAGCS